MKYALLLLAVPMLAEQPAPYTSGKGWLSLLNGRDLTGWHARDGKPHEWFTATAVGWDAATPDKITSQPGSGKIMVNGLKGRTADFISEREFGDVELYLEFLIPKKSNSGVYLQGLYEVQILDSYGAASLGVHDCGAIYERWIDNRGVGGSAPQSNASRPPGEWQSFHIIFRAPRFDSRGHKVENARFVKVVHNGVAVQNQVQVEGPTRASLDKPERPQGPVLIQGDHGPVALRNVYARPVKLP